MRPKREQRAGNPDCLDLTSSFHGLQVRPLIHRTGLWFSNTSPPHSLSNKLPNEGIFSLTWLTQWAPRDRCNMHVTLGPPLCNVWHFQRRRWVGENRVLLKIWPWACLWPPHFLQREGAVIRHSGPGRGTIAQSGSWLLTPSHGLLIRLTFRDPGELSCYWHTTVWSYAIFTDDHEIKRKTESALWATWGEHALRIVVLSSTFSTFNLYGFITSTLQHALLMQAVGEKPSHPAGSLTVTLGLTHMENRSRRRTWANLFSKCYNLLLLLAFR